MEYLVMECHTSYAVVMDREGRFLKTANLGYQVGQELDAILELQEPKPVGRFRITPMLSAVACLCILFTGLWQLVLLSMGTVLIQINPEVRLHVNRLDRVITAEAVNPDGARILFDYQAFGKTVEQVAEELSDRAAAMGYLSDGGEVHLTVDSRNQRWKTETEARLETVIVHEARDITVIIEDDDWDDVFDDDAFEDPEEDDPEDASAPDAEDDDEDDDEEDEDDHDDDHHDEDDDDDDDDDDEEDDDD